jgi:hypothetical protein
VASFNVCSLNRAGSQRQDLHRNTASANLVPVGERRYCPSEHIRNVPPVTRTIPERSCAPESFATVEFATLSNTQTSQQLALQLRFLKVSESMGNHDSKIVDACGVD